MEDGEKGGTGFAVNLERLLAAKGVSRALLARACGVGVPATYQWTSGRKVPNEARLTQIATLLGVTIAELTEALPDLIELDQFSMADWGMWTDEDGIEEEGVTPAKVKRSIWRMPASALRPHGSKDPSFAVVEILGNAMAPEFAAGSFAIVDRNWRGLSPPGVYLLSEPLRLSLRQCEMLLGEKEGLVRIRSIAPGYAEHEVPVESVHVIGRVVLKLASC